MESASKNQFAGCILFKTSKTKTVEVLLVQPIGKGRRKWAIPQVEVGAKEDMAEAARSEVHDETGVKAKSVDYLGFVDYPKYRLHCFFGQSAASADPHRKHLEVRDAKFIPLEEALELVDKRQQKLLNALRTSLAFAA
jgi:ADP-ribose pyrophosphatase YjhB (NUDIX family)